MYNFKSGVHDSSKSNLIPYEDTKFHGPTNNKLAEILSKLHGDNATPLSFVSNEGLRRAIQPRPDQPRHFPSQLCAVNPEISKIQHGQLRYARFRNGRLQTHRQYAEDDDKTWGWLVAREWPVRRAASPVPADVPTCQRPWPPIPSHLPGNNASTEIAWLGPECCRSAADNSSRLAGLCSLSASSPPPSLHRPYDRSRVRVSRAGREAARIVPATSTSRSRLSSPSGRLRARVVHARSSRSPRNPRRVHSPPPARSRHEHPAGRPESSVRPCRASLPGATVARATTRPLASTILEFLGSAARRAPRIPPDALARKSLPTAVVTRRWFICGDFDSLKLLCSFLGLFFFTSDSSTFAGSLEIFTRSFTSRLLCEQRVCVCLSRAREEKLLSAARARVCTCITRWPLQVVRRIWRNCKMRVL